MERKIKVLENSFLKIEVSSLGAELTSLYSKKTEIEYLWQPGYDIWATSFNAVVSESGPHFGRSHNYWRQDLPGNNARFRK